MNIDNLISSFDFDKLKSDCLVHDYLKTYIKKKSNLSSCDENEANMLKMQLEDYSNILERLLKNATCFPSGCENCVGTLCMKNQADEEYSAGFLSAMEMSSDLIIYYENSSFFWTLSGVLKPFRRIVFSPPWCDVTDFY